MLIGSSPPRKKAKRHNDLAGTQLSSLCDALSMRSSYPEYLLLQRFLFGAWGERAVETNGAAPYPSLIGDDHSPYEYSVAFTRSDVELRLLLEAQARRPSATANHRAALELNKRIAEVFPVNLNRFDSVADLFFPSEPRGSFSLWHAVSLRKDRKPKFKVYLNPQARGKEGASGVVYEALHRLGLDAAVDILREEVAHRGPQRDEMNYFSLDLSDEPSARVKVYFCHHRATAADLERSFAASPLHQTGDVAEFCVDMVGHGGPFLGKPVTSCFSFTQGSGRPHAATFHLPIAHYAADDHAIAERIAVFMRKHDLGADRYPALAARFASRPLSAGVGIQSYASFRRDPAGGMLLTVYLSPELFSNLGERGVGATSPGHLLPGTLATGAAFPQARQ
jgi:DMATS type aromatic prenyltransferase